MRWPCALAVLSACGGKALPPVAGGVSLVLDIPNGPLDPKGFASVEVILHEPSRDVTLSTALLPDGTFDLGAVDPSNSVSVEATLRNDSGAAVGYGRTATTAAFAGGSEVVVPVRRPIACTGPKPPPRSPISRWAPGSTARPRSAARRSW